MSILSSLSIALTKSIACSSKSLLVASDLPKFKPFSLKSPEEHKMGGKYRIRK